MRAIARAAVAAALLLPALGCLPLPGVGTPQSVRIENAATVPVRVRIGPFKAGSSSVAETEMLAEAVVASKAHQTFSLPTGRYNMEGVAVTPKTETATTSFTLSADRPGSFRLHEELVDTFQRTQPSQSPTPVQQADRLRQLSWAEQ